MTKTEYAAHAGVNQSAVSNWIKRRHLTPPALRPDGMIDAGIADMQLSRSVDPMMSAGANRRAMRGAAPMTDGEDDITAWSPTNKANFQLLRARAVSASVDAEVKRRKLNEERGKYVLASSVEAEWTRTLSGFLLDVEGSFVDLNAALEGLDARERLLAIRRWWRGVRARAAAANREAADEGPEFVEDTAA
jgi:hypothetical protein